MKNSTYLIILLALGLVLVSYKWIRSSSSQETPAAADASTNAAIENIMTRTSVRSYTDREVTKEQVDTLLRAAMAAPTARNSQPWRFLVIDKKETLGWIAENFNSMTMAKDAAVAIVMCGDMTAALEGEGRDYWVQDVSASTENLLLAAHAMGLGAVWCGIYPVNDRVTQFTDKFGFPENIIPMACVCIGYPSGETTPKDKWKPENIHYNTWKH